MHCYAFCAYYILHLPNAWIYSFLRLNIFIHCFFHPLHFVFTKCTIFSNHNDLTMVNPNVPSVSANCKLFSVFGPHHYLLLFSFTFFFKIITPSFHIILMLYNHITMVFLLPHPYLNYSWALSHHLYWLLFYDFFLTLGN